MTLKDFITIMEGVAGSQPAVKTVVRNDVYRLNALPSVRYGVFAWQQLTHRVRDDLQDLRFRLFYADRLDLRDGNGLESYGGNEIDVQSVGMNVLGNIIKTLRDGGIGIDDYTVTAFNQRFSDQCAGAYAEVTFTVPLGSYCAYDLADFNIDFNDDFKIL